MTWLKEMRRDCEEQYDVRWAPLYGDDKAGLYSNITHRQFIQEFLSLLPPNCTILDAACGDGRYEPFLLERTHSIVGIDQSQGLLYFTAETIENADEDEIRQAFERSQQAGLPVVYGEWPDEDIYHFHPTNSQVKEWAHRAGFEILKEGNGEIWYFHLLLRKL
jgi:SAM-dependent methyltransferase